MIEQLPQPNSPIESRRKPDTSVRFGPFELQKALVAAPMDTASNAITIKIMHNLGALGTLPRGKLEENLKICEELSNSGVSCLYAIGLGETVEETLEIAGKFCDRGAQMVLIDVANGGDATRRRNCRRDSE